MTNQDPNQPMTRQDLEARVITKAWQDDAFKQELISNPKATIIRELGLQGIPDNLNIQVLEETPTTLYLVLPMKPATPAQGELSETELEAVAGGGKGCGQSVSGSYSGVSGGYGW